MGRNSRPVFCKRCRSVHRGEHCRPSNPRTSRQRSSQRCRSSSRSRRSRRSPSRSHRHNSRSRSHERRSRSRSPSRRRHRDRSSSYEPYRHRSRSRSHERRSRSRSPSRHYGGESGSSYDPYERRSSRYRSRRTSLRHHKQSTSPSDLAPMMQTPHPQSSRAPALNVQVRQPTPPVTSTPIPQQPLQPVVPASQAQASRTTSQPTSGFNMEVLIEQFLAHLSKTASGSLPPPPVQEPPRVNSQTTVALKSEPAETFATLSQAVSAQHRAVGPPAQTPTGTPAQFARPGLRGTWIVQKYVEGTEPPAYQKLFFKNLDHVLIIAKFGLDNITLFEDPSKESLPPVSDEPESDQAAKADIEAFAKACDDIHPDSATKFVELYSEKITALEDYMKDTPSVVQNAITDHLTEMKRLAENFIDDYIDVTRKRSFYNVRGWKRIRDAIWRTWEDFHHGVRDAKKRLLDVPEARMFLETLEGSAILPLLLCWLMPTLQAGPRGLNRLVWPRLVVPFEGQQKSSSA